jgi:uncharacterized protein (DUF983 family)
MSDEQNRSDKALYPPVDPFRAGIAGTCPRCGVGRLFKGYINTAKGCSNCGLDYSFADSGDGPVAFVVLIVGFIVVGAALYTEVNFDPPLWLQFLLWVPTVIVLSLFALRWIKGILIALQYKNKAAQGTLDK